MSLSKPVLGAGGKDCTKFDLEQPKLAAEPQS